MLGHKAGLKPVIIRIIRAPVFSFHSQSLRCLIAVQSIPTKNTYHDNFKHYARYHKFRITSFQGPNSHETKDYTTDADKPFIHKEDFEIVVTVWKAYEIGTTIRAPLLGALA